MRSPRLYLGTMTFSWSQTSSRIDEPVALEMVQRFIGHNEELNQFSHHIDTARIYAGGNTEITVGGALSKVSGKKLLLGSKAHPSQPSGLSAVGIHAQHQACMDALGAECVANLEGQRLAEFYLHQPDLQHTLLESLQCLHEMVSEGKIKTIGMSNYHASEMDRAFQLCREYNLTPPTVYQGLYNPFNRLIEKELLPVLKRNNCSFVAYNPLAAGLLSGKYQSCDQDPPKGRFRNNQNYLPRFYTRENFAALDVLRRACEKENISLIEASFRWLLRHSALSDTDGVLIGASSLEQLEENLKACAVSASEEGLPPSVLQAFEEGWELTQEGAFPYWRSYSSDMPDRESLDPGAAYDAAKK